MDVTSYNAGVVTAISNQTTPRSISTTVVGQKLQDLANLVKSALDPISQLQVISGTALAALPTIPVAHAILPAGTYTRNAGGNLVLTTPLNVVTWSATTSLWSLAFSINIPVSKILPWTAATYNTGDQVNYLGRDWVATTAIASTDIPGTATGWADRLSGYVKPSGVLPTWTAAVYNSGDKVNYNGFDYTANATTLTTDVPGVSSKWVDRLSGMSGATLAAATTANSAVSTANDVNTRFGVLNTSLNDTVVPAVPESGNLITGFIDNSVYGSGSTQIASPQGSVGNCVTTPIPFTVATRLRLKGVTYANLSSVLLKVFDSTGTAVGTGNKASLVADGVGGYYIDIPLYTGMTQLSINLPMTDKATVKAYVTQAVPAVYKPKWVAISKLFTPYVIPANQVSVINPWYYSGGAGLPNQIGSATINSTNPIPLVGGQSLAIQGYGTTVSPTPLGTLGKTVDVNGNFVSTIAFSNLTAIPGGYKYTLPLSATTVVSVVFNVNAVDAPNLYIQLATSLTNTDGYSTILPQFVPEPSKIDVKAQFMYERGYATKPTTDTLAYGLLCIGQSNMAGRIAYAERPQWFIDLGNQIPGVNWSYNTESVTTLVSAFSTYAIGGNVQYAFDLYLYKLLLDYWKTKTSNSAYQIYSIKHAVGGTSISVNGAPTGAGFWTPNFGDIPVAKGALLKGLEQRYALIKATATGALFNLRAVIKHQGESDMPDAANYYENAKNELFYVRGTLRMPLIPYVFCGINNQSAQYSDVVEAAKMKIAAEQPNVYYVPSLNGTQYLNADTLHMNSTAAIDMANGVFNIIKDFAPILNIMGEKLS